MRRTIKSAILITSCLISFSSQACDTEILSTLVSDYKSKYFTERIELSSTSNPNNDAFDISSEIYERNTVLKYLSTCLAKSNNEDQFREILQSGIDIMANYDRIYDYEFAYQLFKVFETHPERFIQFYKKHPTDSFNSLEYFLAANELDIPSNVSPKLKEHVDHLLNIYNDSQ